MERPSAIYLDHAATTPVDPDVLAEMLPFFTQVYGNASSRTHAFGWPAADAVELARARVAKLLGAAPDEVTFTSGATEANALALLGLGGGAGRARRHIVSSPLEHRSVLACLESLAREGFEVTWVGPRADGRTHVADVLAAVRADTLLVTLMWVNNETGVINPIPELAAALDREHPDVLLHSDATQAIGRIAIDLGACRVDLLSLSAHKLYGPKGVGALIVRGAARAFVAPIVRGGGQERGLRGGTLNVPGIVGFGKACELARERLAEDQARIGELARRLYEGIAAGYPGVTLNAAPDVRVPGIASLALPGVSASALLKAVGGRLALSAGSACAAGSSEASHVLLGLGLDEARARSTIRVCVGRTTTIEEVDDASAEIVAALRTLTPAPTAGPHLHRGDPSGDALSLAVIGRVISDIEVPEYIAWREQVARVALEPEWSAALDGLEHYSHLMVLFWMHHVGTCKLTHVPQGNFRDAPEVGIFACRCPYRPNPIAVTTVRLLRIDGLELVVEGLDAVNGTPVIDIKPYTPRMDAAVGEVRVPPWVDKLVY